MIDVLIIGGGSAGLYLANKLMNSGVSFLVIEKRVHPSTQTKAIGIHPPALKLLDQLGLLDSFLSHGVKITEGMVFIEGSPYGKMPLGSDRHADHVLSIPQFITEQILEAPLPEKYILRGHRFQSFQDVGDAVRVTTSTVDGDSVEFLARYIIGADGMNSAVRTFAGISWVGQTYPYSFTMGDFPDSTSYENRAVIHIGKNGLTESFPLPDDTRRWVVNHSHGELSVEALCDMVKERTGYVLSPADNRMFSNFAIHRYLAGSICRGRVILLGDAAHVMSPIGGQSMNVAWIHADKLGELFAEWKSGGKRKVRDSADLRVEAGPGGTSDGSALADLEVDGVASGKRKGRSSADSRVTHGAGGRSDFRRTNKSAKALSKFRSKELASSKLDHHLREYEKFVKRSATIFSSRAEFNTKMGLPGKNMFILKGIVKILLSWPLSKVMSKRFTMKKG